MTQAKFLRILCVTNCSDLPETELFIGLRNAGVEIEVMCNPAGRNYSRLRQPGAPILESAIKGQFDINGITRIRRQLRRKPYDILHSFDNRALQNSVLASIGISLTIVANRGFIGNVSFFNSVSWLTYLHPKVKRISCDANAIRDYFLSMRLFGLNISPQKVITIYKGHNPDWYQDEPADLINFGIPEGAFVVGFAGRDRPGKGVKMPQQ